MINVDEHVLHEIDDALQVDIDKEEILRKVTEHRAITSENIYIRSILLQRDRLIG